MGKHKYSKGMGFLHIFCKPEIHTIPKTWKKWILIVRKTYEKHKHSNVKSSFHNLSRAEIHAIPKAWNEWISVVRQKYGKKQTFQNYDFLNISC